ncbi:MAG TPA: hypothetical protein VFV83_08115 [Chthoniobacteraceae bacterium]|nr:hypothetical protein [Chthoniobacteraceae bacterium]
MSDPTPSARGLLTAGRPIEEWLKDLLAQDDEIIRTTGFLRLLETLKTSEEVRAIIDVVTSVPRRGRGSRGRELGMLLQKWTEIDPKAAIEYASAANGNDERRGATSIVLRAWTRLRADEALAWARENGKGENAQEGNWAIAAVVTQLARSDIDRAIDVASQQEVSRARGRTMDTLVSELIAQRGGEAARLAVADLPASTFRDALTAELAGRLADANGAQTAKWVLSLPPGDGRTKALAEVVNEWAEDDAVATGNFLSRFPISPETDPSRERYAWNVLRADPEAALAWAGTISQEAQRTRAIESLVRSWMRRDAPAARDWVAQSSLPPQLKTRLSPGAQPDTRRMVR